MDMLRWQITSRSEFERLLASAPGALTDLERAARFLYLQRTAFGGKVNGRTFGVSVIQGVRFDVVKLGSILEDVHERLTGVVIERLPWADFLRRYDRPQTLFYLDPPYFGNEGDYDPGVFAAADFEKMADLLAGLSGHFLLSLNDHPEVRRLFRSFQIEAVSTTYTLSAGASRVAAELLISTPVKTPFKTGLRRAKSR